MAKQDPEFYYLYCKTCNFTPAPFDTLDKMLDYTRTLGWGGTFITEDGCGTVKDFICPKCLYKQQHSRKEILAKAEQCICADRETQYGSPENNFACIANLWNAYKPHLAVTAQDVGIMLALLKIGRIASGQTKEDNFVDLAGYAACAGEIALSQPK